MAINIEGFSPLPADFSGWNGNNEIFTSLVNEIKPKTIIEIGSWKGQSTISMAKVCKALNLDTKIYCIDTWLGALEFYTHPTPERDLHLLYGYPQIYYQFLSNIIHAGVVDMIIPIPLPSSLGIKVSPEKADLIYIDASHEYEDVKRDIEESLKRSNVVFGDDYTNAAFPGVKKAVDEHKNVEIVNNWFWLIRN